MLFDRWRQVVSTHGSETALWEHGSGRTWTFRELDRALQARGSIDEPVVFPQARSAEFLLDVLAGWRDGRLTCPLEPGRARPAIGRLPAGWVHLKGTSASTGTSRWVGFRPEQLAADVDQLVAGMGLRPAWPNIGMVSLAHSYGFSNLVLPLLLHGIPLVLVEAPLPEALRRAIDPFDGVTVAGVPALWRAWTEAGVVDARIRLAISAGAPLPLALEVETHARCGVKIHNFYGASECGGIAYDTSDEPRQDSACVGSVIPGVRLDVSGEGCLEVRGPAVGAGYWPEPDARLADGCFRSTDLAELEGSVVRLRGRAGEVIHVAGQKVSPESIERVLAEFEGTEGCVAFGVPSRDAGRVEEIVAVVALRSGWTEEGLRRHALGRLPGWQVPRRWWITPELRVNERGKLSRHEWRRRFLERG